MLDRVSAATKNAYQKHYIKLCKLQL